MVEGDIAGSWQGLPSGAIMMNWNLWNLKNSLTWFSGLHPQQTVPHRQVIAGYYDSGDGAGAATAELQQALGIPGIAGLMYTTWVDDYSQLKPFADAAKANWSSYLASVAPTTVTAYSIRTGSVPEIYRVDNSSRKRLPWQISDIQITFSGAISFADTSSLAGVTVTGVSGVGTSTLTFTISPISVGNVTSQLLGTGPHAILDSAGRPITAFSQNFKVLWGDFNDDGIVNASDLVGVNNARSGPYNILADMNGDGVLNLADVQIVRNNIGHTQP